MDYFRRSVGNFVTFHLKFVHSLIQTFPKIMVHFKIIVFCFLSITKKHKNNDEKSKGHLIDQNTQNHHYFGKYECSLVLVLIVDVCFLKNGGENFSARINILNV